MSERIRVLLADDHPIMTEGLKLTISAWSEFEVVGIAADGQRAVTHWRVLCENEHCTLVILTPQTGRTHQIRVHMAHIGFPLLGDDLYGGDCTLLHAHALHCGWLRFREPAAGETVTLTVSGVTSFNSTVKVPS